MVKIKNKEAKTNEIVQHEKMPCPRCSGFFTKKIMRKLEHPSGAILDVCDSCRGMWLDKEEVEMLYKFAENKP